MGLCISSSSSSRRRNSSVELVDRVISLPDEVRVDRISSLPDEVLIQIISLLDMRRAVLTGILSSKWRGLWANTESLDFDGFKYYGIYDYSDDNENKPFDLLERDDFFKFMVRSLKSHLRPTIHKFRLLFGYKYEYDPYIDEAILFAVRREVKELFVEFPFGFRRKYKLPAFLFVCESLVSLYLKGCNLLLPEFVRFSSLVSLSVLGACLENDSILRLINGCPLLEDLVLEECAFYHDLLEIFPFAASGELPLKRLTLRNNVSCESDMPILIQIEAPKLEVLNLFSFNMYSDSLNNMFSLREVSLEIIPKDAGPGFLPILESWLEALHHVRVVKLCRACIQCIQPSIKNGNTPLQKVSITSHPREDRTRGFMCTGLRGPKGHDQLDSEGTTDELQLARDGTTVFVAKVFCEREEGMNMMCGPLYGTLKQEELHYP